ncbi:hypothetical protein BJF89_07890 [Corynebacterium sp. CNJ-954]|uniref:hypothetical protein n=1 Tax=Corynebacterium sp. CNJ-954 TaxID=1904962 RepID=UPI00095B278E|nr:hypothetical protein [Corynebacterium sp. CNJ-954]OLT51057.1 hypothetical protein BJF89_07890 [Corynebacterium sp. CNJ-954]
MDTDPPVVLIAGMNLSPRMWSRCDLPAGTILVTLQDDSMDEAVGRLLDELPPRFILGVSASAALWRCTWRPAPRRGYPA